MPKNAVATQDVRIIPDDQVEILAPGALVEKRTKRAAVRKAMTPITIANAKSDVWDKTLAGFGVRVTRSPTGFNRSYRVMYRLRGTLVGKSLGNVAVTKLGEARENARVILAAAAKGIDPTVIKAE